MTNQFHLYKVLLLIISTIFFSCQKNESSYLINLANWNKYEIKEDYIIGEIICSHSFNENYNFENDSISYSNIIICTDYNNNDTIIVFDIFFNSNIDTINCNTCHDIYFNPKNISKLRINVPFEFKNDKYNNSKKFKYVFGDSIVNLID